jgi:hypothetical protein
MAVGFRQHPSQATNDEVHLLQSTRFLRGTAPLVSAINEGQIVNALTDVVYYPGSPRAVSEAPQRKSRLMLVAVLGRFRYSDLKEAAGAADAMGLEWR